MDETQESKEKVEHLRKGVHYAKLTCTNMKPSSLLRLTKNSKSLESHEYGDNLMEYLETAQCVRNITLTDLTNVLHGLTAKQTATTETALSVTPHSSASASPRVDPYKVGEHVAATWWDRTECKWHIGVVDSVDTCGNVAVSYLVRSDTKGIAWVYPEDSQVFPTVHEQIIERHMCQVSPDVVGRLNTCVENL